MGNLNLNMQKYILALLVASCSAAACPKDGPMTTVDVYTDKDCKTKAKDQAAGAAMMKKENERVAGVVACTADGSSFIQAVCEDTGYGVWEFTDKDCKTKKGDKAAEAAEYNKCVPLDKDTFAIINAKAEEKKTANKTAAANNASNNTSNTTGAKAMAASFV